MTQALPVPLVRIRCGVGKCRQVLIELREEPEEWTGTLRVPGCRTHDTLRRSFFDEVLRRQERGLDPKPHINLLSVSWADLRHNFYLADTLGKTQEETLKRV